MDCDSESKLISLICQSMESLDSVFASVVQIISLVRSMDLNAQPKPETEFMSLVTQTISLFNSMDFDERCLGKPLYKLMSFIYENISVSSEKLDWCSETWRLIHFFYETSSLEQEPELLSLIHQIFSLVTFAYSKWPKLICLCPQLQVRLDNGRLCAFQDLPSRSDNKWHYLPFKWEIFSLTGEDATHFHCPDCNGEHHEEHRKTPVEVRHILHRKHSLQLVGSGRYHIPTRNCYCCEETLMRIFYCCLACNFAMNVACVEKPLALFIGRPKWHQHRLALFPRQVSLVCNLCALTDSTSCPFYMCPPCEFVVHSNCLSLPRVIRISRHPHRISFTPLFGQGDWFCGVCRKRIDNDYGGYSCIKEGCSYAAHSRCATQSNVWDGIELEGVPDDIEEEEIEPFVRISNGIIQHFSHQQHHLKLDEDIDRDYDDNKLCQACITPIYSGNFYSCMKCEFILHEGCANLPRKIHHPIHPHKLSLVVGDGSVIVYDDQCVACGWVCMAGFFYKCSEEECSDFRLDVHCATISEPLVRETHMHPLFLTTKPEERRKCCVCHLSLYDYTNETFNCIECEFSMCFGCATIPEKVRYKHDKHMLTLSYEKETSTMEYWCEACETKIKPEEGFYKCDEYCCVTIHIKCLLGNLLYMKRGSSVSHSGYAVDVLPNNHHMTRPICSICEKRCPDTIFFQCSEFIYCSIHCSGILEY